METYVIHVTKECNCACKYCYETDKTSQYTWDEIKALIDKIIQYRTSDEFQIEYLGGEPMLAFDYIKKATNYLDSHDGLTVHYTITTNGTILTESMIRWLKKNASVTWAASMDGTCFMNQLRVFREDNRNTHDTVIDNFKRLAKRIGANRATIHMVTHQYNVGFLSDGIDHLYQEGVRHIGVGTVESTIIIDNYYVKRLIHEMDIISERLIAGDYPGLFIDLLHSPKPLTDVRHYIHDESGKTIAETYGRSGEDITKKNDSTGYNAFAVSSPIGKMIENARHQVYVNYQSKEIT